MPRLEVRMALVVEVVEEPDEAPLLLVGTEPPRVRAHRRLDRQHVAAQRLRGGPLLDEIPGLLAIQGLRHGC
jgi:hypothetical protein